MDLPQRNMHIGLVEGKCVTLAELNLKSESSFILKHLCSTFLFRIENTKYSKMTITMAIIFLKPQRKGKTKLQHQC